MTPVAQELEVTATTIANITLAKVTMFSLSINVMLCTLPRTRLVARKFSTAAKRAAASKPNRALMIPLSSECSRKLTALNRKAA